MNNQASPPPPPLPGFEQHSNLVYLTKDALRFILIDSSVLTISSVNIFAGSRVNTRSPKVMSIHDSWPALTE